MEHNYQILIEYDGSKFCRMAVPKKWNFYSRNSRKKIKKITKEKIKIIGAGRTDAGVHAKKQSANFF